MTVINDLLTAAVTEATSAQTNSTQAQAQAATAKATADTPGGQCLEGYTVLDQARDKAALSHEAAGKAQQALAAATALNALNDPLLPAVTGAPLTNAQTQVAAAVTAAAAADTSVGAAEPVVRQNYVNCLAPQATATLLACINAGTASVQATTNAVSVPNRAGTLTLPAAVQELVNRAVSVPAQPPGCNEGLQLLADARERVNSALAAVAALQNCLSSPDANPALPAVAQALATVATAQGVVGQATALLDSGNAAIKTVWMQRYACRVSFKSITIHVTDESGDNMGSGMRVSLDSHAMLSALQFSGLPIPSGIPLNIPSQLTGSDARTTFQIPCPPVPDDSTNSAPALAPPAPANLPMFPNGALLLFTASHNDRPSSSAAPMVGSSGLLNGATVEIPVPASSL